MEAFKNEEQRIAIGRMNEELEESLRENPSLKNNKWFKEVENNPFYGHKTVTFNDGTVMKMY